MDYGLNEWLASAQETQPALVGRLLYSQLTNGTWQLWMMDLASAQRTQLTFSAGDKRYPAWTPEGHLTFHTNTHEGYLLVNEGIENAEPLVRDLWPVQDIVWAPNGQWITFSKLRTDVLDHANVWVVDVVDATRRLLTQEAGLQYDPAWSPDSTQLVYVGSPGYGTFDLYVTHVDGTNVRRLTTDRAYESHPTWSPDGRHIAFASNASGDYEIWVIDVDGAHLTQLTDSPGLDTRPAWSPDGRCLAFTTNRTGKLEIWVMARDGSDPRPVIAEETGAQDPAWR